MTTVATLTPPTLTPQGGRRRRGIELIMLGFAIVLTLAAYSAVQMGVLGRYPTDLPVVAAYLVACAGVAHLAVRRLAPYADPVILPVAFALNGLGLVLIHRLDLAARAGLGSLLPSGDAGRQMIWTALSILLFVAVLGVVRDHRLLQRYTYTAMVLGLVLLLLPMLPVIGTQVNGARIWIHLGPLSFQPGEIAKVVLMVFFAGYLVAKREVLTLASRRVLGVDLPRARDLGPILVAWAASVLILVGQSDLGTSLLFFGGFVAVLYVATERLSWILIGMVLFVAGSWFAVITFAHVAERFQIWLHPFRYAENQSYQLVQGLYGFAAGGILGRGLGRGMPELVPYAKTDFIVATIGEELGLTGLMAVLVLYLVLAERGLRSALGVRDTFGKLLAAGLTFSLALQVFVVVGGVTRLIPLTGLTTPFLSYGGSSLVTNYVLIALLLRISDAARRPAPTATPATPATVAITGDAPTQAVRT